MLVLTRKINESIVIGDNVRVTIVEVAPGRVKIGVEAPKSVRVDRSEVHEKKQSEQGVGAGPSQESEPADRYPVQSHGRTDEPVVIAPHGSVVHTYPTNRLESLRRRFPRKPR